MSSVAVSVISLLCIIAQLLYICVILYLLRLRRQRVRDSLARLPPSAAAIKLAGGLTTSGNAATAGGEGSHGHTLTQTGFYDRFLPHSFHSVDTRSAAALSRPDSGREASVDFSYQTSQTPVGSADSH